MNTYIAYFDETGDDGITTASSDHFILTSLYMPATQWQSNFNIMHALRKELKILYGFHTTQEMHTKHFLTDKNPYRSYNWSPEIKQDILIRFVKTICEMDLKIINVIIDKNKIRRNDYPILKNALTYSIQRIENDSNGRWNYLIITDQGRISPMRKTARAIRAYNPIQSKYMPTYSNQPIQYMFEDILEKNSAESYFIQICDYISFFVHLYFDVYINKKTLPTRVGNVIDKVFVGRVMATLKENDKLNLKANENNPYGFVIYPK
ncbi:MAG: DUF3800 domain-containing protein [Peptococcaceae bacterium]|nr:DUF3800 domain-containing protein [Peptococcaceae bacterium]MBO5429468.1 DUF3800 domain-containing protein [Peptococcaceae bacterium]MBP3624706.1 DUF3800 domain-containing protein [Peptococcaceae bacterium]